MAKSNKRKQRSDEPTLRPGNGHETDGFEAAAYIILESSGAPKSAGTEKTPERFGAAWQHFTSGYTQNIAEVIRTFDDGPGGKCDEMVFQGGIQVHSHCEHHLVPFFGVAHIAYIPTKKRILGLSKFSRIVEVFSRRLQVQERLTNQIADALTEHLSPHVGVVLRCRHLCMESRGIQRIGQVTYTNAVRGSLKDEASARAEFMTLVQMADGQSSI
jgi:GTP cyclohydrolase IA